MNSTIASAVIERSQMQCEYRDCRSAHISQLHHIIKGKGKRTKCETEQSIMCLCWEHHYGNNGVHGKNGHNMDLELKLDLQQKYYNMGKQESEVRRLLGGKIYSEEDYIND